jgi:hypothetical protein
MNMNYDRLTLDELRDAAAVALAQHRGAAECSNLRVEIAQLYCTICDLMTERLEIESSLKLC